MDRTAEKSLLVLENILKGNYHRKMKPSLSITYLYLLDRLYETFSNCGNTHDRSSSKLFSTVLMIDINLVVMLTKIYDTKIIH